MGGVDITVVEVDDETLAEAIALNEQIEAAAAASGGTSIRAVGVDRIRASRKSGSGPWPPSPPYERAVDRTIDGPAGPLRLRTAVPDRVDGVFLHIHGGGWALGAPEENDSMLELIAERMHLAVVSVDYRLSPEHPYPAGADDCEAAAHWLLANAMAEYGTDTIVIGGDSAGANLAATTLLRLRDQGLAHRIRGAAFLYGVFDLGMSPSVRTYGDRQLILTPDAMEWMCELYVPGASREERRAPDISPLYADLHDLPPALFLVGALDALLDDTVLLAARWSTTGNEARCLVYPESIHGFDGFPTRMAALALDHLVDGVRTFLP